MNYSSENVGIAAMEVYFPKIFVDQSKMEEFDGVSKGKYIHGQGQHKMSFITECEDSTSMALTCMNRLLENNHINPTNIGRLEIGTETIHDHAKSIKTDMMDYFKKYNNTDIEGVTTYNACYGGTAALFNTISWMESKAWDGRLGIVIMTDVAVYEKGPARPTSGAGAMAFLITPNAPITFNNLRSTHMTNAYDFYKPNLCSEYPIVDGAQSINCYVDTLSIVYENFKRKSLSRLQKTVRLDNFDRVCFHAPFTKQIYKGYLRLIYDEIRSGQLLFKDDILNTQELDIINSNRSFLDREIQNILAKVSKTYWESQAKMSGHLGTLIGNIYTGSLYLQLASVQMDINSKKQKLDRPYSIGMYSYGSGQAATWFEIYIKNPEVFSNLNYLDEELNKRIEVTPEIYHKLMDERQQNYTKCNLNPKCPPEWCWGDQYVLTKIDEKFRRTYNKLLLRPNIEKINIKKLDVQQVSNMSSGNINRLTTISKHLNTNQVKKNISAGNSDNRLISEIEQFNGKQIEQMYLSNELVNVNQSVNPRDSTEIDKVNQNKYQGFYKKSLKERYQILKESHPDINLDTFSDGGLNVKYANHMVENCIGKLGMPQGLGLNFVINQNRYSVPMCIEEPSVIAAASGGAKFIADNGGGFQAFSSKPIMIGQVQIVDLNVTAGKYIIEHNRSWILSKCNSFCANMQKRGGGVFDFRCKQLFIPEDELKNYKYSSMLIFEFLVNVCDSMGANIVNTIAEGISPYLSDLTGGRVGMRILSNLCSERRAISFFKIPINKMAYRQFGGREMAQRMLEAYMFAKLDPFRAATHNKGIMNGVDAVALATGQDWRAIEAGIHSFHSANSTPNFNEKAQNDKQQLESTNLQERYGPLSKYEIKVANGIEYFCGYIEIPIAVGTRGGAIESNPAYKNNQKILNNPNSSTLSEIMASVGLAQNFSALRALVIDGIQKSHMSLHGKNLAVAAGVPAEYVEAALKYMKEKNSITKDTAREFSDMLAENNIGK